MLINLTDMIKKASNSMQIIPAFNVFGYEDAKMVIEVAEELNAPVILQTNKDAIAHMSVKYYVALFQAMSEDTNVKICLHLDHTTEVEVIKKAIEAGYTSVMYDGSQLSIEENIKITQKIVKIAHANQVSVEAEIGSVGYSDPNIKAKSIYTEPEDAKLFEESTKVDALAVAVGTVHRMETQNAVLQYERLTDIQKLINTPLVIHGSSGIQDEDLKKLTTYKIGKINIGTALRMAFGNILRKEMNKNPKEFDRIKFFKKPMEEIKKIIRDKYRLLGY